VITIEPFLAQFLEVVDKYNGSTMNLMVICDLFMGIGKIVYMWLKYSLM
jgi:hypothetical protein